MALKIDENSVVPISWVLSGFAGVFTITVVGAFWVSAVDYRLKRIEEKLGIPHVSISGALLTEPINDVFAGEAEHGNTKRLLKSLGDLQSHK